MLRLCDRNLLINEDRSGNLLSLCNQALEKKKIMYDAPSSRIIFNFGDSCNMRCPYCYVPFRSQSTEESRCRAILTRIADLGFKVITFGGGDPFKYNFFPSLIEFSYEKGLLVHIDTNGIGIKQSSKRSNRKKLAAYLGDRYEKLYKINHRKANGC